MDDHQGSDQPACPTAAPGLSSECSEHIRPVAKDEAAPLMSPPQSGAQKRPVEASRKKTLGRKKAAGRKKQPACTVIDGLPVVPVGRWEHIITRKGKVLKELSGYEYAPELEQQSGLASEVFGPTTLPLDVSSMSPFKTVELIARKWGTEDFDVRDQSVWTSAIKRMLNKVERLDLTVDPPADVADVLRLFRDICVENVDHPFRSPDWEPDSDKPVLELLQNGPDSVLVNGQVVAPNVKFSPIKVAEAFSLEMLADAPGVSKALALASNALPSTARRPGSRDEIEVASQEIVPDLSATMPVIAKLGRNVGRSAGDVFFPVLRRMLTDLDNGGTTPEVLAEESKKDLAQRYGGGPEVNKKARATVWVVRAMRSDLANERTTTEALSRMASNELYDRYEGLLERKQFGLAWDIFGKARRVVLEDEQRIAEAHSRQLPVIDK